jgi:hypothetical protein
METDSEYIEGNHSEFIRYVFGNPPKPQGSIVLESPPEDSTINVSLHQFQQLLMIFVDSLKYLHGDEHQKVNINTLTTQDIDNISVYFKSFSINLVVDIFDTVFEYQFKHPNYFRDQHLINDRCELSDFYYEIYGDNNRVFRVTFDYYSV